MSYKLGSLFDGSGGFPLAGSLCGIEPRWASEVEPYPIAVTRARFPNMKHLGDISKINGAEIEPVDIVTFGSPCQDLSVAGKRAGLKHEANGDEETTRSGLFMEAVRIIKEMREATNGKHPRFALWENVPGAFSSNKGEDFRVVCEELIKIAEPAAYMPPVPKNGWAYADSYVGDGWSLAYRVFDAQYWGVPQRRRRIHLVVDFGGERAREVLFEREGVRGYFAEGRTPWKGIASDAEGGTGAADREGEIPYTLKIRSGCEGGGKGALIQTDKSATLSTLNDQYLFQPVAFADVAATLRAGAGAPKHEADFVGRLVAEPTITDAHILDDQGGSQISVRTDGKSPTLRAEMHGNVPCVLEAAGFKAGNGDKAAGIGYQEETAPTLTGAPSGTNQVPTVVYRKGTRPHSKDEAQKWEPAEVANTLNTFDTGEARANELVVQAVGPKEQHLFENHSQDTRYKGPLDVCPMLPAQLGTGGNNTPFVVEGSTPTYCLQGSMIGRADKNGPQGDGVNEGQTFTLNTTDRHAVAYAMQGFGDYKESDVGSGLKARDYKDATDFVCGVDCRNATEYPELNGTLQAKPNGGFSYNNNQIVRVRYIVRRLTPTECARLQGFADWWSYIEPKEALTDAEYEFWCKVNLEYAMMQGTVRPDGNGGYEIWKEVKPDKKKGEDFEPYWENTGKPYVHKSRQQMLAWYNKLWTDSAEYKMWGNGIALPPALYCLQGIHDALTAGEEVATQPVETDGQSGKATEDRCGYKGIDENAGCFVPMEDAFDYAASRCGIKQDNPNAPLAGEFSGMLIDWYFSTAWIEYDPAAVAEPVTAIQDQDGAASTATPEKSLNKIVAIDPSPVFSFPEDEPDEPDEPGPVKEAPPATLNAVEQLRRLASERQTLARLNPDNDRFLSDARAIEYAVSVLEAVGL